LLNFLNLILSMENFLHKKIDGPSANGDFQCFEHVYHINKTSAIKKWFWGTVITLIIIMFLPWTQNIRATGTVTTLRQEQRPQQLNTVIPGKVVKWHIKEGDFVKEGDTIITLSEVKDEYFNPQLLERTKQQIDAKHVAVDAYENKASTAELQYKSLEKAMQLKTSQYENKILQQRSKVQADSMDMLAAENDFNIALLQYNRQKIMYDSGLVSLTQFEQRNQVLQNATAKRLSAQIKFANSKQEVISIQLEQNGAIQDYTDKISKARGDRYSSLSDAATGEGEISKMENQYSNYTIRAKQRIVTAPQSGQVIKAKKAGIGEIVKEGEMIVEIVPDHFQYAVEMFVKPYDLPLIEINQKVQFTFDGVPAIVFSGWPKASYGSFRGRVAAVESSVGNNGLFRVLVAEDPSEKPWPNMLKMGGGAKGIALLKEVPVWYELWRQVNGFPPDYYNQDKVSKSKEAKKQEQE
jgi:multidrug efflux pump subunit AcrA (membrane-fusion protein)